MRRILTISLLLVSALAFGQSETHNMITYDTIINYNCLCNAYDGCTVSGPGSAYNQFVVRITRPVNYFTPGSPDTASRYMLLTWQGDGEVSNGVDTFINHYGPHYWLANGWNGSIQLRNGTHYPLIVTVLPVADNLRPNIVQQLMDSLFKEFHPNSVGAAGLSGGVEVLGWWMMYCETTGNEHNMARISSFVNLEGVGPVNNISLNCGSIEQWPNAWGHWAKAYGGKAWCLEGTADPRSGSEMAQAINDSVPGAAYFTSENASGGTHCCWNTFYCPDSLNWQNITPPYGNAIIVNNTGYAANTAGNYVYDPVTGTNVFQWMMRQGDTSLSGLPYYDPQDGAGEYVRSEIKSGVLYTITTNSGLSGTNSWVSGVADSVTTTGVRFIAVWPGLHTTYAIDNTANANLWTFGANTMAQCMLGNTTATIQTPTQVTVDSLGNPFIDIAGVAPFYCANNAEGAFVWKKNNDTLWIGGRTQYAIRGDGTYGSVATLYPTAVWVSPDGTPIRKVIAGQHVIVLTWGGNCYGWGGVNSTSFGINLQDVGTNASGTSYMTAAQIPISHVQDIAGGLSFNFYYDSSNHIWSNGYWGEYQGSTNGNWHPAVPTKIDSLIYPYMDTAAISFMGSDLACTHIISAKGTLYGFGDNASGNIGDGNELNFASATPGGGSTPYSWDFGRAELPVYHPEQITDKHNWTTITYGSQFGLHVVARDAAGNAYSWGRGKGAVLANKTVECSSTIGSDLPNSFDVTAPKLTANVGTITGVTTAYSAYCPGCRNGVLVQADSPCNTCTYSTVTPPTANAGSNQTISTTSTTISASASTDPVQVINYKWVDLSGLKSYITLTQNVTTTVDSLATGVHTMQLTVYNPGGDSSTTTMTITVNGGTQTAFYVSQSGTGTACSSGSPCSLSYLNTLALAPGDIVYFQAGGMFSGTLYLTTSGTSASPIVYTSYGSGAKPIFSGYATLSGGTNEGGGIYGFYNTGLKATTNLVTIGGQVAHMARWPNSYYWPITAITSSSVTTTLPTSSNLANVTAILKDERFCIDTIHTPSNSSGVFSLAAAPNYTTGNGKGIAFENARSFLDTSLEFYVNPTTDSIYLFGSSGQVSVNDTGAYIAHVNYVTLNGLEFTGYNQWNIFINNDTGVVVNNCLTTQAGNDGITANQCVRCSLTYDTVTWANNNGLTATGSNSNHWLLQYDQFAYNGRSPGMGKSGGGGTYEGINQPWGYSTYQYVVADSNGSSGVVVGGDSLNVYKVHSHHNGFVKSDGGNIYLHDASLQTYTYRRNIDSSQFDFAINDTAGVNYTSSDVNFGAYFDAYASGLYFWGNTCAYNPSSGVFDHGPANSITYTTAYGNGYSDVLVSEATGAITGLVLKHNNLGSTASGVPAVRFITPNNDLSSFGVSDSNYLAGATGTTLPFYTQSSTDGGTLRTLAGWTTDLGYDTHSTFQAGTLFYASNPSGSPLPVTLPGTYMTLAGTVYNGSITLAPYSSALLLAGCGCLQLNKNISVQ